MFEFPVVTICTFEVVFPVVTVVLPVLPFVLFPPVSEKLNTVLNMLEKFDWNSFMKFEVFSDTLFVECAPLVVIVMVCAAKAGVGSMRTIKRDSGRISVWRVFLSIVYLYGMFTIASNIVIVNLSKSIQYV